MSDELKPCPFCGRKPSVFPRDPKKEGDSWTKIICPRDRCAQVEVLVCSERGHYKAAAKRWNTRAALTPPEGFVLVEKKHLDNLVAGHDWSERARLAALAVTLAARPEMP